MKQMNFVIYEDDDENIKEETQQRGKINESKPRIKNLVVDYSDTFEITNPPANKVQRKPDDSHKQVQDFEEEDANAEAYCHFKNFKPFDPKIFENHTNTYSTEHNTCKRMLSKR